jgi:hypothetical protein
MITRLGNVIYWGSVLWTIFYVCLVLFGVLFGYLRPNITPLEVLLSLSVAPLFVLFGWAVRYILAGSTKLT